jgi:hypothetical protein
MKLVWHIVRKDASQHKHLIAGVCIAAAVFALPQIKFIPIPTPTAAVDSIRQIGAAGGMAALALVVLSWLTVASLVHAEGLAGTNDHWLSRPVPAATLFAAKAIGVLLFVVVPLVLLQIAILSAAGFALTDYWLSMMNRTAVIVATWILPVFGLATITRNWQQLGAGLVCMLALAACAAAFEGGFLFQPPSQFAEVVENGIAMGGAILATAIAVWQYRSRNVRGARIAAAIGLCAVIIGPAQFSPALYSAALRMAPSIGDPQRPIRVVVDPTRKAQSFAGEHLKSLDLVTIPVRVDGLPAGVTATISLPRPGQLSFAGHDHDITFRMTEDSHVAFNVYRTLLRHGKPIQLRVRAYVTVRAEVRHYSMPALNGSLRTPELGHCESWVADRLHMSCQRPYEFSSTIRGFLTRGGPRPLKFQIYSHYPAPWPLEYNPLPMPLEQASGGLSIRSLDNGEEYRDSTITIEVSDVLTRFEQDIVIDVPASALR